VQQNEQFFLHFNEKAMILLHFQCSEFQSLLENFVSTTALKESSWDSAADIVTGYELHG
jgi:hypothetical protein